MNLDAGVTWEICVYLYILLHLNPARKKERFKHGQISLLAESEVTEKPRNPGGRKRGVIF